MTNILYTIQRLARERDLSDDRDAKPRLYGALQRLKRQNPWMLQVPPRPTKKEKKAI